MSDQGDASDDQARLGPDVEPALEQPLPHDVLAGLARLGITSRDEVSLRRELESHLPGYTLYRLLPAARRRWRCEYRIMFGDTYFDCHTVSEAYARALIATVVSSVDSKPAEE